MNTLEIRNQTKEKIDVLFNEMEALKVQSVQVKKQLKGEWNEALSELENTQNALHNIYNRISDANEATIAELKQSFDNQWRNAETRINHLKERYSKTMN